MYTFLSVRRTILFLGRAQQRPQNTCAWLM